MKKTVQTARYRVNPRCEETIRNWTRYKFLGPSLNSDRADKFQDRNNDSLDCHAGPLTAGVKYENLKLLMGERVKPKKRKAYSYG